MTKELIKNIIIGLLVLAVVGIYVSFSNKTDTTLSKSQIKEQSEQVLNKYMVKPGVSVKVTNVTDQGSVYKLDTEANGQKQPLYITKDGKKIILEIIDIDELKKLKEQADNAAEKKDTPTNVTKTDKPKVELFVMSYCPYGTQFEKGFLPVINKLGNKIDSKIKFVNYAMHGKKELDENTRQYCIEKNQPKKSNSYLSCFLEKGDFDSCLSKNNIDTKTLNSCMQETDTQFNITKEFNNKDHWLNGRYPVYKINDDLNKKYGVGGSPTLVINGAKVQPNGRDSNSILKSICSAFTNPPAVCKENISSKQPTAGFGYKNTAGSETASCGA